MAKVSFKGEGSVAVFRPLGPIFRNWLLMNTPCSRSCTLNQDGGVNYYLHVSHTLLPRDTHGDLFFPVRSGSMIISLLMNINLGHLGGASILRMFTTTRPHGSVNTTTWLGISEFFLFLAPNFNILTTENRSICNRDLN